MRGSLATAFTGIVANENKQFYFVQKNDITFRLKKEEGTHIIGEAVEGFGYLNQKQEPALTTTIPTMHIGGYSFGTIAGTRRDLGIFVDVGLPDKDVVISLDELPTMREFWSKEEDQMMVTLRVDSKDRIWGELADEKVFKAMVKRGNAEMQNQNLTEHVYRLKLAGTYILTDDLYIGFIHPSERFRELRLGEKVVGRITGVRSDGVLSLSLKPRSHEVISDDVLTILTFLERANDHRIPFIDRSSPDEIRQAFDISKARFKRVLDHLMKQKLIRQENDRTVLIGPLEQSKEKNQDS